MLGIIRQRAGIEEGDGSFGVTANTREEMIESVMLERKIEMAFEDKRHWDLRRRNMYINDLYGTPKLNGTRRHGLIVELNEAHVLSVLPGINSDSVYYYFENVIMDTLDLDAHYTEYFNTTFNVEMDSRDIFIPQPKYNFYFMPKNELERNKNLRQTINWTNVSPFDPLDDLN